MSERARAVITEERLEQAVAYMAYLVLRHGEVLIPIFDRLEAELEAMRHARSPMARARAALNRYTISAETAKAIR